MGSGEKEGFQLAHSEEWDEKKESSLCLSHPL